MHTVIETAWFIRAAEKAGMSADEREAVVTIIARDPMAGESLGHGYRKLRMAGRSQGKRGGFRVITFFSTPDFPAFLITVFGKGEKASLTAAEMNELKTLADTLVEGLADTAKKTGRRR